MLKIFEKKIGYKGIDLVSVLVFLEMVSVNLTNSAIILFALDLDASIIEINVIKMATIIIPLIFQIPFGIISDKLGRKSLIILQQITFLSTAIIRSLAKNPLHHRDSYSSSPSTNRNSFCISVRSESVRRLARSLDRSWA